MQTAESYYFFGFSIGGDKMHIYDGSDDQSEKIESIDGERGSFSILSQGNSLLVKFKISSACAYWEPCSGFFATIHYGKLSIHLPICMLISIGFIYFIYTLQNHRIKINAFQLIVQMCQMEILDFVFVNPAP